MDNGQRRQTSGPAGGSTVFQAFRRLAGRANFEELEAKAARGPEMRLRGGKERLIQRGWIRDTHCTLQPRIPGAVTDLVGTPTRV